MKKSLKDAAVFFCTSALIVLCYLQIGNGILNAQPIEPSVLESFENDDPSDKDAKSGTKKTVSAASSSKAKSTANAELSTLAAADAPKAPVTSYTATAYSLRGRTATGSSVRRGIIAADPRVLPLGTQVRLSAGAWSGTYLVADTGGAVKGRKIDLWVPNTAEARKFGRRKVMLTVINRRR